MHAQQCVESNHRILKTSAPRGHLDAIGDFAVGIGGVQQGDLVAQVGASDTLFTQKLRQRGAQTTWINPWPSVTVQPPFPVPVGLDLVVAFMALHLLAFPCQTISELKGVIKPGGRLVMADVLRNDDRQLNAQGKNVRMGFYTSDIRHWLDKAGFSNIIVNPIPYRFLGLDANVIREQWGGDIFLATGTA